MARCQNRAGGRDRGAMGICPAGVWRLDTRRIGRTGIPLAADRGLSSVARPASKSAPLISKILGVLRVTSGEIRSIGLLAGIASFAGLPQAHAQTLTEFNNRAAWEAAAGGSVGNISDNLDANATNRGFYILSGSSLNAFPNENPVNTIDGSGYARFLLEPGRVNNGILTFGSPITALGFDLHPHFSLSLGATVDVAVSGGGTISYVLPVTDVNRFVGFVASAPFSTFTITSVARAWHGVDNIELYSASPTLTAGGDNTSANFSGVIQNSSSTTALTKVGTGTLTLSGTNTYTGATTINAGVLNVATIDNGGVAGNLGQASSAAANLVLGGGTLQYTGATASTNRGFTLTAGTTSSIDVTYNNLTISGASAATTGALTKTGAGTLTFTAANGYTGLTTISAGTLAIGNGGTTGSIAGNVVNNAALSFNRYDAVTFAGDISGTGALQQNGAGSLALTGITSYTGTTTVNAGTLVVNGSIASSPLTTVNALGTLGGAGTVGNTAISGGTLAPGNSIGTLSVNGNLSFTAASSYRVEVSPSNADRVNVTGTATLGGATVNASFAPGSFVARQYSILNAAGGLGGSTFGTLVNTNLPSNVTASLSYDANNAYLDLKLNFAVPRGLNGNQTNVGNALTNFFNTTGGIPLAFAALTPSGLSQVSGETATGSQQATFNAMNQFMGLLTDLFIGGRGDAAMPGSGATPFAGESDSANTYASNGRKRIASERDAYAMFNKAPLASPDDPRWRVWAAGYSGSQSTDGNVAAGSRTTTSGIYGVAVGADYRLSPDTLAGFALAGGATSFNVANNPGSGRSDLFHAGAFIRHNAGAAYLSSALAFGWQDITTNRTMTVAGIDQLHAQFNANVWSGRVEGGYRFVAPMAFGITPYAAGQFTTFNQPAYAEQALVGANTFALAYGAKSITSPRSELGLRTDKSYALTNAILTLRGRLAWTHDFNPNASVAATFQTLPGASFVTNGAAAARDAALTTASAEVKWRNGFSLAGTFEGEFSNVTRSYAGKGVARYSW